MIKLWWHEPSNGLDIVLPGRMVWRCEGSYYYKWYKFRLAPEILEHAIVEGWVLIGEFN